MYTLMAVFALTTSVSTASLSQNPTWLNDYGTAQARVTYTDDSDLGSRGRLAAGRWR